MESPESLDDLRAYLDDMRARLARRLPDSYDRLADAVTELVALHDVDPDAIHGFVREVIKREASGEQVGSETSTSSVARR